MKTLKKLLLVLMLLVVLIYCILFAVNNSQLVPVDLIFLDPLNAPLSMLSLGMLTLGLIFGSILSLFAILIKNIKIKRLQRQLNSLQKQMNP